MNVAYSMKVFMNYYDGFMKLKSCYHVNKAPFRSKCTFILLYQCFFRVILIRNINMLLNELLTTRKRNIKTTALVTNVKRIKI